MTISQNDSLIIADDLIGASIIQNRQLRNFLLDRVRPSEERTDVRPIHALTGIDQRSRLRARGKVPNQFPVRRYSARYGNRQTLTLRTCHCAQRG
jgi:hypothetical protein